MSCNTRTPAANTSHVQLSVLQWFHACRVVAGVLGENLVLPDFITKVSTPTKPCTCLRMEGICKGIWNGNLNFL